MRGKLTSNTLYGYLSGYRSELMGVAILLVIWFHAVFSFEHLSMPLLRGGVSFLQSISYGGVDLFIFVSGFGIWHSLKKNQVSSFFLNRLKKILPVWWTYLVILVVLRLLVFHSPMKKVEILGFAFFTEYWQGMSGQGNWYVYAIMLFYLISPVLFTLMDRSRNLNRTTLLILAAALLISFSFFYDYRLMAFARLPLFIVGMYIAAAQGRGAMQAGDSAQRRQNGQAGDSAQRQQEGQISRGSSVRLQEWMTAGMTGFRWILCLAVSLVCIAVLYFLRKYCEEAMWSYGLWWYPFIVLAPLVSILICRLFYMMDRNSRHIGMVFRHIGEASLEILLASDFLYTYYYKMHIFVISENITSLVLMTASVVVGLMFHFLIEQAKKGCARLIR